MLIAGPIAAIAAGIVAYVVTTLILRLAGRIGVVAEVNERSSHSRPTPSGGGVGIVAGGSIGAAVAALFVPWPTAGVALLAAGVALLGFLDDRWSLSVRLRLPLQVLLVAGMVALLPLDSLAVMVGLPLPALALALLVVLATIYWINIFNFMDGIDGIAASEAIFVLLAAGILALAHGTAPSSPLLWWLLAIAAATLGFAFLNWPPARIFMGDAGSTYLGFMLAYAGFATLAAGWLTLWQWLILVAVFVTDATLTLLRRLARREPVFRAHRLHAYQHLSRRWRSHRPVTLLTIAINLFWLLPCGWAAGAFPHFGWLVAAMAYLPLIGGAALAGSGAPERKP